MNHIEKTKENFAKRPVVKFVVGIEDIPYFHWQLPIMIESLMDKLPHGWELFVVVCNNNLPLSEPLSQVFPAYNVKCITTTHYPQDENIDFAGGGDRYSAINRIQALNAVADFVAPDDLICLLETDMFLYKDLKLHVIPRTNSLAKNWIVQEELFFSLRRWPKGVNLPKLLEAMGCTHSLKPGGGDSFSYRGHCPKQKIYS